MMRKILDHLARTFRKLERIHEFAPSFVAAAVCLTLFFFLMIGAIVSYVAGWYTIISLAILFSSLLPLKFGMDALTDVNMVKMNRRTDGE